MNGLVIRNTHVQYEVLVSLLVKELWHRQKFYADETLMSLAPRIPGHSSRIAKKDSCKYEILVP